MTATTPMFCQVPRQVRQVITFRKMEPTFSSRDESAG